MGRNRADVRVVCFACRSPMPSFHTQKRFLLYKRAHKQNRHCTRVTLRFSCLKSWRSYIALPGKLQALGPMTSSVRFLLTSAQASIFSLHPYSNTTLAKAVPVCYLRSDTGEFLMGTEA